MFGPLKSKTVFERSPRGGAAPSKAGSVSEFPVIFVWTVTLTRAHKQVDQMRRRSADPGREGRRRGGGIIRRGF